VQLFDNLETLVGFYPKNFTMTTFERPEERDKAKEELEQQGVKGVYPLAPEDLLRRHQETEANKNPLARLASAMASDEAEMTERFVEAARAGQAFLLVQTPDPEDVERVREIIMKHGARMARAYNEWTVTEVPLSPRGDR
jgi:hypothetical protein